jgi:hypothetical protein
MQRRSCGFGFLIGYMHPSLYYGKEKQMMLRVDMEKSVPVGDFGIQISVKNKKAPFIKYQLGLRMCGCMWGESNRQFAN